MFPINTGKLSNQNSSHLELTDTHGLKVNSHLNKELTAQIRQFEETIDYILTYRGDSKSLLNSVLDTGYAIGNESFKRFATPQSQSLFALKMSREQIYFVAVTFLKHSQVDFSGLVKVDIVSLARWFKDVYGRSIELNGAAIEYINEIKINNNEVTFDSSPYNMEQARVHIKGDKFDDKYWLDVKAVNTKKYIGSAPLRFTNSQFPQCDVMQFLTAADLGAIVSHNTSDDSGNTSGESGNTSYDRHIGRKRMLEERLLMREVKGQNIVSERDTLCRESFQKRFDIVSSSSSDGHGFYRKYEEIHRSYFVLQQVDDDPRNGSAMIISNIKEIGQEVMNCASILVAEPKLKSMYVTSRNYHHAVALIFHKVGELIKVRLYDSESHKFYVAFYIHRDDLSKLSSRGKIGIYLFNAPFFRRLVTDNTTMHFGNFICRIHETYSGLTSKKYHNNNLELILDKFGSQLSTYATQLIFFTITADDYNLAIKIFSNKNFAVPSLYEEYFKFEDNVVGLFVTQNKRDLVTAVLDSWSREFISRDINKVITYKGINRNSVDWAIYIIKNICIAELLIKHGGLPSKFMENGELLPEFKQLSANIQQLLRQKNDNYLSGLNNPRERNNGKVSTSYAPRTAHVDQKSAKLNIMDIFFKQLFIGRWMNALTPIGARAS